MGAREHSPPAGDDPAEGTLDEFETEVVEDLDVDDDASDVIGGASPDHRPLPGSPMNGDRGTAA